MILSTSPIITYETLAFSLCGLISNNQRKYNNLVQVVLSAFVAASQAAPQLVYPYGLGYSHAITHAVPTTVKKVNIETKEIKFELKVFNYDSTKEYQIKEKQNLYKEFSHTMCYVSGVLPQSLVMN